MSKLTLLRPRLSEKSYMLGMTRNVYAFDVPADANKHAVAAAVVAQFEVEVTDVRLLNIKGKAKRSVRKGGRPIMGQRSDIKKAYVTLAEGSHLPFFDEPEEEKTDKKAEKKAAKKAEKESK
jgi:large subunit ribosomal protein L23